MNETTVAWAVIFSDCEPTDTRLMIPDGVTQADRDNIPLVDRDGNRYVGRMVSYADTYTVVNQYETDALTSGQLHDGTECGHNRLFIIGLAVRPRKGSPLKFSE